MVQMLQYTQQLGQSVNQLRFGFQGRNLSSPSARRCIWSLHIYGMDGGKNNSFSIFFFNLLKFHFVNFEIDTIRYDRYDTKQSSKKNWK